MVTAPPTQEPPTTDVLSLIEKRPSVAVRAAIHGLQQAKLRSDFVLNMHTYGDVGYKHGEPVCVGCMATVAIQSLCNVTFTDDNIWHYTSRAKACNINSTSAFEFAINDLRLNSTQMLYEVCKVPTELLPELPPDVPPLDREKHPHSPFTANWRDQVLVGQPGSSEIEVAILRLTQFAEQLEALGV